MSGLIGSVVQGEREHLECSDLSGSCCRMVLHRMHIAHRLPC